MAEYWDIYNKNFEKINKRVKRGDKLEDDEYHLVINAWIVNSKGEFLITQRVATKPHPLMWECTGGSAIEGDNMYLNTYAGEHNKLIIYNMKENKIIKEINIKTQEKHSFNLIFPIRND